MPITWIPSLITVIVGALTAVGAPDWIASNPTAAVTIGVIYALVKGLLPSPVAPTPPK